MNFELNFGIISDVYFCPLYFFCIFQVFYNEYVCFDTQKKNKLIFTDKLYKFIKKF